MVERAVGEDCGPSLPLSHALPPRLPLHGVHFGQPRCHIKKIGGEGGRISNVFDQEILSTSIILNLK